MRRVVIEIDGVRHVLRHGSGFACGSSCSLFDLCGRFDDYLCKLAIDADGAAASDTVFLLDCYFEVDSESSLEG